MPTGRAEAAHTVRSSRNLSVGGVLSALAIIVSAGVVNAEVHFTPSLTVSERYEDNARFVSTNKQGDFSTVVTPDLGFTGRAQELDFTGHVGATWWQYMKETDLSRVGFQGSLSVKADTWTSRLLPGLGLTVMDSAIYTQEFPVFAPLAASVQPAPLAAPVQPASGGVQAGRFNTFGNNFVASSSYVVSQRVNLNGSYVNSMTRFSSTSNLINTRSNSLIGGWSYAVSPVTTFLNNYTYTKFSFTGNNPIETYATDVGARRHFASDLEIEARVGASYVPSLDRLSPNFNVEGIKKFYSTDVRVRVTRSIGNTGGLTAQVSTSQVASATVTHRLTPSLTAVLGADYSIVKSVGLGTVDVQVYDVRPSLNYAFSRTISVTASYLHYHQHSQGTVGFSFDQNMGTVGVTVTWP